MEFRLNEEQRLVQESARRMAERDLYPVVNAEDPDRPLQKPVMLKLLQTCASLGLTSARVPESAGGAGHKVAVRSNVYATAAYGPISIAFELPGRGLVRYRVRD